MKDDISCVFEGIDNNGAIYVSGVQAAENLKLLRSTHTSTQIATSQPFYQWQEAQNLPILLSKSRTTSTSRPTIRSHLS